MIYSVFDKPSDNMNLSNREIAQMIHEQNEELYRSEAEKVQRENAALQREREERANYMQSYINEQAGDTEFRTTFLENVKTALMAECIMRLYTESMVTPMTRNDKIVARNLVNRFVLENGAGTLVNDFATKSLLLSEFSRITTKYYNMVLESDSIDCENGCCNSEFKELNLAPNITDEFYKELEDIDMHDASKLIKDRVADAISEFIDTNMANKLDYEEVIKTAQDKIAVTKDESMIEAYSEAAQREINEMKLAAEKNIFHCVVESLSTKVFKDEALKARYIHESKVDMDAIVNSAQLIYTMLEMTNTTNMVNVDVSFMERYLESLQ